MNDNRPLYYMLFIGAKRLNPAPNASNLAYTNGGGHHHASSAAAHRSGGGADTMNNNINTTTPLKGAGVYGLGDSSNKQ